VELGAKNSKSLQIGADQEHGGVYRKLVAAELLQGY
jgi:hypothetical protein